jgi:citrate/tricarballylate utilization protein
MPLDDLFAEAERQMNICNSCRYCEGYCPVWPALELRTDLTTGDMTHLANLCHDCQDCFTACMYTAPHEFELNPPKIFAELREDTYRRYVWPRSVPEWLSGRRGVFVWFLAVSGLLIALSYLTTSGAVFSGSKTGSAYELIPHLLMVGVVTAPSLWAVGVLGVAVARYWRDTHGRFADLLHVRLWLTSLVQGAQLRHMSGGGEQCAYPDNEPASSRKRFHLATSYGFGLCMVSTTSAAIMQELFGVLPPYDYLSVPVITGTVGGLGMLVGCVGLVVLKGRSDRALGTESMRRADYGLLWALLILSVTGLLTLVLRTGVLFAPVLVVHLASVIVAFGIAPYTKFVHWIYRLLAIYKGNLDQAAHAASDS